MTGPFDDRDVTGQQSLDDMVAMAMARQVLRPLVPGAPPQPSAELAEMLTGGLPAAATSRGSALLGRLAGIGLAGKLMLATGVALAGGTATVAFTHDSPAPHVGDVDVTGQTPPPSPASPAPAVVPTPSALPHQHHDEPATGVAASPRHDRTGTDSGSRSGSEDGASSTDRHGSDSGTEDGGASTSGSSPKPSATASSGDGGDSGTSGSSDDSTSTRDDGTVSGGGDQSPSPDATITGSAGSDDH